MSTLIQKIFSRRPDGRIAALAKCVEQNRADEAWVESFVAQAKALHAAAESRLGEFIANPSDGAAKAFLAARVEAVVKELPLNSLSNRGAPVVAQRNLERIRPVLKDALTAIVERVEAERAAVEEQDAKSAEKLGLEVSHVTSPVIRTLEDTIGLANKYLAQVDTMTVHQVGAPIKFCLES